jgi:hypothetical protein
MSGGNPDVKIDPILLQQLDQVPARDGTIEAVFVLRPPDPAQAYLTPEQTQSMVKDLLAQVERQTGESPQRYNVFKNLGSFVVDASPQFIRAMLEQDGIASAAANRQPGSAKLGSGDQNQ